MNIPPGVFVLLGVAVCGSAVALAAFVWAVATGQLDPHRSGAAAVFDDDDSAAGRSAP